MDIINVIYSECEALGSAFGFGAFEGGVIYFSIFSLLILKVIDAIKVTIDKKKSNNKGREVKGEDLAFKIKIIK